MQLVAKFQRKLSKDASAVALTSELCRLVGDSGADDKTERKNMTTVGHLSVVVSTKRR
jgi:hypothetical protein